MDIIDALIENIGMYLPYIYLKHNSLF